MCSTWLPSNEAVELLTDNVQYMVAKQPHLSSPAAGTVGASSHTSRWPPFFCIPFCTICMCRRGFQSPLFPSSTDSVDGVSGVASPQGTTPLTCSSLPDNTSCQTCSRTVCWWSPGPRGENELRSGGVETARSV
jgi:hypothetical protein